MIEDFNHQCSADYNVITGYFLSGTTQTAPGLGSPAFSASPFCKHRWTLSSHLPCSAQPFYGFVFKARVSPIGARPNDPRKALVQELSSTEKLHLVVRDSRRAQSVNWKSDYRTVPVPFKYIARLQRLRTRQLVGEGEDPDIRRQLKPSSAPLHLPQNLEHEIPADAHSSNTNKF